MNGQDPTSQPHAVHAAPSTSSTHDSAPMDGARRCVGRLRRSPSMQGQHNLPNSDIRGRRMRSDGHATCRCDLRCKSCVRIGRHCRRASCCGFCHKLFHLDARAVLLEFFDTHPELQPDLEVRFSGHGMSLDAYRQFRRTVTNEFSRAKIPYGLFTSFEPMLHDAGFTRGVRRRVVVDAIKRAARRCGITLGPGQFAVAKIHDLPGYVRYLTDGHEVNDGEAGAAPRYYRVFTAGRRLLPSGLSDGRSWMWFLRATHPDPGKRIGATPSSKTLEQIMWNVQMRRERYGL